MKNFFFDVETTGLSSFNNSIHQLAYIIEIDNVIKEKGSLNISPYKKNIDYKALELCNVTKDQINKYPNVETQYKELTSILGKYIDKFDPNDKFYLIGYNNSKFDDNFLREFFFHNKDKYFGSWFYNNLSIDILRTVVFIYRKQLPNIANVKLSSIAKFLRINVEASKLHEATYDVELTYLIYKKITKLLNKKI